MLLLICVTDKTSKKLIQNIITFSLTNVQYLFLITMLLAQRDTNPQGRWSCVNLLKYYVRSTGG